MGAALIDGSIVPNRSPGGAQVDHQGDGSALADRLARPVRHRDIRHHRSGVLFGDPAQDVLQHRKRRSVLHLLFAYEQSLFLYVFQIQVVQFIFNSLTMSNMYYSIIY